ncbi:ATPase [Paenibacillus rigui]|uniref:ATPase n=2 Tax=Paenibacillus rigui TaxID=554312 RepID=A0A229UKU4_9BACL|nr:ATPase [Paenibacillus rigui]
MEMEIPKTTAIIKPSKDSGNHAQRQTLYEDYSQIVQGIEQALQENYGQPFELFVSEDGNEDYWELLEQDLNSEGSGAEVVGPIFAYVEAKGFAYAPEEGAYVYRTLPTLRNNLFAYPAWGVAMARVPVFRAQGIFSEDFIWAVDESRLKHFLAYTRQRRRDLDRCEVTVFTDGPHGVEKELTPITRMVEREEVVMSRDVKEEIYRSIDQFFAEDRSFYQEYEIPYKRGILLYGKPGNGKTTLVKSIAGSVKAPAAYWQITEHTCSDTIQEVFHSAVRMAHMILIIEDIDSMPQQARSYFLNTLDGATSKEGIFLIGTTNYPENIDPALMNRAGRFDRAYEIRLPDAEQRRLYLTHKGLHKLAGAEKVEEAARLTAGFTFAQLNELYVSAALEWHYEHTANVDVLIKKMKAELDKGRTQSWNREEETERRVGFLAM